MQAGYNKNAGPGRATQAIAPAVDRARSATRFQRLKSRSVESSAAGHWDRKQLQAAGLCDVCRPLSLIGAPRSSRQSDQVRARTQRADPSWKNCRTPCHSRGLTPPGRTVEHRAILEPAGVMDLNDLAHSRRGAVAGLQFNDLHSRSSGDLIPSLAPAIRNHIRNRTRSDGYDQHDNQYFDVESSPTTALGNRRGAGKRCDSRSLPGFIDFSLSTYRHGNCPFQR